MVEKGVRGESQQERDPSRAILIRNPDHLKGNINLEHLTNKSSNTGSCYIVNGGIERDDANFLRDFAINEIGDSNIMIGPYPLLESDAFDIAEKGATAVLNLQTKEDMREL